MAVETQIGDFFVTYMVFPAFPKPNEPGRINLYIQGIDERDSYTGEVTFSVLDDSFFSDREEPIGTQPIDDGVYRQGFVFSEEGEYFIRAHFYTNDAPYDIDFPLQVGEPSPWGPLLISVVILVLALIGINIVARRKSQISKFRMQNSPDKKDSTS
ncbi:MAG: hypothetical protein ABGY96_22045 [bacterium]|nr:hypothetical protein [Gammaproteobacteria bacterium]HIL98084.1 hypothetical protein [Pseudomonadales bacterium]